MYEVKYIVTGRLGQQIGSYQLVKLLGKGGYANVYLGKHRYLHSYAALKVLNTAIHALDEPKFLAEAQALADLRHANIVHLLDFVIENSTPVLIMEYALKGSLRQYYPDEARMPLTTLVDFVAQIAAALQYAHDHHVIHRDVKPENVLLDADNRLLLSDFGLSLFTPSSEQLSTQDAAGTARYMAPEQLRGKPCFASDQYALAVMVFEWLCGRPPFGGNMWEVSHEHLYTDPPPLRTICPELPVMLEQVVGKALAKKPEDRFVNVQAFAQAFAEASQISITPVDKVDLQVNSSLPVTLSPLPITTAYHDALYDTDVLPPQNDPITQIPGEVQAEGLLESSSPPLALQNQNRMRLLQRVRSFWITGVLEQSLYGAALITLGLQEQPDAVVNPWQLVMQETVQPTRPLPADPRITQIYDDADGELLILGEPGAGKTTLLLELARNLLMRAERDLACPMPVVFNLSSWTRKRQSLRTWLIEDLETKYRVPRKVGSDWINANQILPLLDGLDEVDVYARSACIQVINDYHQAHSLVPLVVCCRTNDYLSQAHKLSLSRAVTIQKLSTEQINEYLGRIGEQGASLRIALQNDVVLQELAKTPLMLTVLIMTYQGSSLEEIKGDVSTEVRLFQIFANYTQQMLQRRHAGSRYEPQQTINWLSSLAQQMKQQSQTVFYIERMQPTWLRAIWQRRLYYGLITGPICGLLVGLETVGSLWSFPLTVLLIALVVGLLFGWLSEPGTEKKSPNPIAHTWVRIRQHVAISLESRIKVGVGVGFIVGIGTVLYQYLGPFAHWSLGNRMAGAGAFGLLNGIFIGVSVGLVIRLERRIEPLEALSWSWTGIRKDIVRWFPIGTGLIVGLIFVFPFLMSSRDVWLSNVLSFGLATVFQLFFVIILISGVRRRLSRRVLDAQHIVTPNQGTWRSARYGVIMAIITGGMVPLFTGAIDFLAYFWLPRHLGISIKPLETDFSVVSTMSHLLRYYPTTLQGFWMLHALFWGPISAVIPALAVGLTCGGAAYLQHVVLRFLLWCSRRVPFNYSRFLDYATERILLRKVGGGYIFIHGLLLEYFASLAEERDSHKPDLHEHKAVS